MMYSVELVSMLQQLLLQQLHRASQASATEAPAAETVADPKILSGPSFPVIEIFGPTQTFAKVEAACKQGRTKLICHNMPLSAVPRFRDSLYIYRVGQKS